jgi:lipoate---protein ligase
MQALTWQDIPPEENPTGEELLDRARLPFKFWVPKHKALVLGHSQDAEKEIDVPAAERDGIPIHRRMGGGGTVLLSPGCFCVGLRFARQKGRTLHDYFAAGSGLIQRAVHEALGVVLAPHGLSDLAYARSDGKVLKVAGCSLYMPRDHALYLASVLVNPDFAEIATYLPHPSKEPDYRGGRAHGDFLVGLRELARRPLASGDLIPFLEAELDGPFRDELDWPP